MNPPRVSILGVRISAVDMRAALGVIEKSIADRRPGYICLAPAHLLMDGYRDPNLRKILNRSTMVTPDGMAVVWLLRARGYRAVSRVYGPDLMLGTCERAQSRGWRLYFVGGAQGVAEALLTRLRNRFPALSVAGYVSPPFRSLTEEEDSRIVNLINAAKPDIVWVGLGSPRQERWMADHRARLAAPVLVGVGAAFDFLSGAKPQAPHWIQRSGLEWLFRLATEPRRLWRRYAQYPLFGLLVAAESLGLLRVDPEAP